MNYKPVIIVAVLLGSLYMLKGPDEIRWLTATSRWRDVAESTGRPVWMLYTMQENCPACVQLEKLCDDPRVIDESQKFTCIKYVVTPDDPILENIQGVPCSMFLTHRGNISNHMGVSVFPTPNSDVESLLCHLQGGFNLASKALRGRP